MAVTIAIAVPIPIAISVAIPVTMSLRVAPSAVSAIAMVLASCMSLVLSGLVDGGHVVCVLSVRTMMRCGREQQPHFERLNRGRRGAMQPVLP